MADITDFSKLNSIFKEVYSKNLFNLVPNGVSLLNKVNPLYNKVSFKRLQKTDLGSMLELTDEDNREHSQLK